MLRASVCGLLAMLLVSLPTAPRAQDYDLAASAKFIRAAKVRYDYARRAAPSPVEYAAQGTSRAQMGQRGLQHEVWKRLASLADRLADAESYKQVDFAAAQASYATSFPGSLAATTQGAQAVAETTRAVASLGTKLNAFRSYSDAFKNMSDAGIVDTLDRMSRVDPFRRTDAAGAPVPLDTIESYQKQIDAVIEVVEKTVSGSNSQFTAKGYRVESQRRWAVYRDVMKQFNESKAAADAAPAKLAALKARFGDTRDKMPDDRARDAFDSLTAIVSDTLLDGARNTDHATYDPARFVRTALVTTTDEILRSARGRTEAENKRDKVKDIDEKEVAKEAVVD